MACGCAKMDDAMGRPPPSSPVSSCLAVQRFTHLLQENPNEFDIAILSDQANEEDYPAKSIVLQKGSLGVNALDLPRLSSDVRHDYWQCRRANTYLESTTKCLLLLCPDHATAWADRRRHLLRNLGDMDQELSFLNLLMTKHTKAPSSWFHRKWVLQRLLNDGKKLEKLIRDELSLCTMVAQQYPKNYYAWTHRLFCICKAAPSLVSEEWNFVIGWLPRHVSDHSAVHYAGQVLQLLMQSGNDGTQCVQKATTEAMRLTEVFPTHEILWIFRRNCASVMMQVLEKDEALPTAKYDFIRHLLDAWKEGQESKRPSVGSEVELEWRQTHVYRLSYIVWVGNRCSFLDHEVTRATQKATQALKRCDFIPYNLWRIKDGLSQ